MPLDGTMVLFQVVGDINLGWESCVVASVVLFSIF